MYVEINDGRDGCLERYKVGGGNTLDRGNKRTENGYKYWLIKARMSASLD